jgi:ribosomal 30S subunit maturation factor RimM
VGADIVTFGHVLGSYGVAGWIKIEPYSERSDALLQYSEWWAPSAAVSTTHLPRRSARASARPSSVRPAIGGAGSAWRVP